MKTTESPVFMFSLLTNFWCNNWRSIIYVVEILSYRRCNNSNVYSFFKIIHTHLLYHYGFKPQAPLGLNNPVREHPDSKIHIFCEGHKILRNIHLTFDYSTYSQKKGEHFAKFCGLLRRYEIYDGQEGLWPIFLVKRMVISFSEGVQNKLLNQNKQTLTSTVQYSPRV